MPYDVSSRFRLIDRMSRMFKKIGGNASKAFNKIKRSVKGVNTGISGMTSRFGMLGKIGTGALAAISFATIGSQIKDTINLGMEFEQTFISATAKLPGEIQKGSKTFNELKKTVLDIGTTTEFQARQAAEGLKFFAMAGFDANQSMASLKGTVNLATANEMELGRSVDIVTDTLGAFNMITKDSAQLQINLARASNVMSKGTNMANVTLEQLFETIKEGGGVALSAGQSIEQFVASALLISSVEKGSKAGTSLKNMLIRLQAPVPKARQRFKELGITLTDSSGKMKRFDVILDELNKRLPQGAKRAQILNDIFGKIPIAAVNLALTQGGAKWRDYLEQLKSADGFTNKLAKTMRDTTQGQLKQLTSAVEGLKLQLFEAFQPVLIDGIKMLTKFINILNKVWKALGPAAPIILDLVVAIGAAIAILTTLGTVITVAKVAFIGLNTVFVATPIGWVITIVAALIFALIMLIRYWDDVVKWFDTGTGKVIKNLFLWFSPIGWIIMGIIKIKKLLETLGVIKKSKVKVEVDADEKEIEKKIGVSSSPGVVGSKTTLSQINKTNETIEKSSAEVTIRDKTGRAEITKKSGSPQAFKLDLPPAWSFN